MRSIKRYVVITAVAACALTIFSYYVRETALLFSFGIVALVSLLVVLKAKKKVMIALVLLFGLMTSLLTVYRQIDRFQSYAGQTVSERFVVVSEKDSSEREDAYTVLLLEGPLPRYRRITLKAGNRALCIGDVYETDIKILDQNNPNHQRTCYAKGLYAEAKLSGHGSKRGVCPFLTAVARVRRSIKRTLFSALTRDNAAVLIAVLTGDKTYLTPDYAARITATGISHIMVVSGLHLIIMMEGLLRAINLFVANRYARFAIAGAIVTAVLLVCGFGVSLIRAGLMVMIGLSAPLLRRESDSLSSLAASVLLILLVRPLAVFHVAFQLSVLSTYGLIVIAPGILRRLTGAWKIKTNRFLRYAVTVTVNSVSATLMVAPVLAYTFGSVSVVAVLTNLLITYAVTAVIPLAVFALLCQPIRPLFTALITAASVCTRYISVCVGAVSRLPVTDVRFEAGWLRIAFVVLFSTVAATVIAAVRIEEIRRYLTQLKQIRQKEA